MKKFIYLKGPEHRHTHTHTRKLGEMTTLTHSQAEEDEHEEGMSNNKKCMWGA